MRFSFVAILPALLAGACMPTTQDEEPIPTRSAPGYVCNAAAVQHLVGQVATRELAQEAVKAANAWTLRYMRPGEVHTMEYREDRLNLHIDERNVITKVNCG